MIAIMRRAGVFLFIVIVLHSLSLCAEDMHPSAMMYHGRRMSREHDVFFIAGISTQFRQLFVEFNIPVDPRTVLPENILVNGAPLSGKTNIKFGRNGLFMEVKLDKPCTTETTITLSGITAFDGTPLPEQSFSGVIDGCRFRYARPKPMQCRDD
jgi:hypothetical protein